MRRVFLFIVSMAFAAWSTELWMVHGKECVKGSPFSIEIHFGEFGVKERPFFGKLVLYLTDPLQETYKVPLRRERSGYFTTIIPDIAGRYYLRCEGLYFGDRFIATSSFYVKSFLSRLLGEEDLPFLTKDGIVVKSSDGFLELSPPKTCRIGWWQVKDPKGEVFLEEEGKTTLKLSLSRRFLAIYNCGEWVFTYYNGGD